MSAGPSWRSLLLPAWHRHLGRPAWLALALLAALMIVQWQLRPALQHERAQLDSRSVALAAMPPMAAGGPAAQPPLAADELPSTRQRGRDLETLVAALQRAGLSLDRADYSAGSAAAGGLLRVEATLPLTGNYAALRRFVADALNALPHAALESLQIERATAQSSQLQATARLVLFYAEEAP
ncbi:MAG: hypothetical protein QM722_08600 [Piscinibacter sp.]